MTISIAALFVGIAVDDAIHYIHPYKSEHIELRNYLWPMHNTHASVRLAMLYTVIIANFINSTQAIRCRCAERTMAVRKLNKY